MARMMAVLCGGVLLGILATIAFVRFGPSINPAPGDIVRDIVDVPQMAQAVAEKHRDEQYASLGNIEQVLALPTEFSRSEALHVLAGRSDSAGVQSLIFEANRVADSIERVDLLNVLFFRLTESDPQSALALARMDQFKTVKSIERTVWRAWARKDLEGALFAAKTQASLVHQNFAAQGLFAAFGYMGNETTDRIEAELEIGPDRSSRGRYLYQLADRSPAEAIAFINGIESSAEQQEYLSWLAYYVSLYDPAAALQYADHFESAQYGSAYSSIINSNIALEDPKAAVERMLSNGEGTRGSREFRSAITALAGTDMEAAKQFYEQAQSADHRQILGWAIAVEMAGNDPIEALAWARANDKGQRADLEMAVLGQIAQTDPQLALAEAMNSTRGETRMMMVSSILQRVAATSPAEAVAYLDQIQNRQQRLQASEQLVSSWIRKDSEAAIDWILSQDKETARQLMRQAGRRLLNDDVDAAIRLLPRLDGQDQAGMRAQIAQQLASTRSPDEAQAFIRQFQGQPGYDQLQVSMISGAARSDVLVAKLLADQLEDGPARNNAYMQIIGQRAQTHPIEAARWLDTITDENSRGAAAGQLAAQWYANDPVAATQWASNLPGGSLRDDAIMHISSNWGEPTVEQKSLIASIKNREKRGQAKIRQIYTVMRSNPARAREMLQDEDISSEQREQVENMINRYGVRF